MRTEEDPPFSFVYILLFFPENYYTVDRNFIVLTVPLCLKSFLKQRWVRTLPQRTIFLHRFSVSLLTCLLKVAPSGLMMMDAPSALVNFFNSICYDSLVLLRSQSGL